MHWITAKAEHIGGRSEQQDRSAIFSAADGRIQLLLVADGMGGHTGGALAAQTVIDAAQSLWNEQAQGTQIHDPEDFLKHLVYRAQDMINELAKTRQLDPHSTLVAALLLEDQACWTHVGDSRLYHFADGSYVQRTKDHSLVQLLVDMGRIQEEEMGSHRDQNYLLRGLGGKENTDLELEFTHQTLTSGTCLALCSDGLWEHFSHAELAQELSIVAPEHIPLIVQQAVQRGGPLGDNVSLVVAWAQ